jgi:hypothetical protein
LYDYIDQFVDIVLFLEEKLDLLNKELSNLLNKKKRLKKQLKKNDN